MLKFKSEDERTKALEEFNPETDGEEKLNEIRGATIEEEPAEPEPKPPEGDTTPDSEPEPKKEPEVEPEGGDTQKYEITDLKGHKTPGELLKSYDEKQALIERQQAFIRESLEKQQQVDPKILERLEKAERELEEYRRNKPSTPPTGQQKKTGDEIKSTQDEIKRLTALQEELDRQAEADDEVEYTPEYRKKQRELNRLMTKSVTTLTELLTQATTEIAETRRSTEERFKGLDSKEREKQEDENLLSEYKQMDSIDDPEYKLSKPAKEVEGEYIKWRKDIATAYYGRAPRNEKEEFAALDQLQIKNPDLMQRCAVMGYNTEPSDDVSRYINHCELVNYRDGYRKNPATGKWDFNTRVMVYDPIEKKQIPYVLRSTKEALQAMRMESGYYDKKADGAFQQGAEDLANASMRRDKGAVTLDGGSDQGQTKESSDAAFRAMAEMDMEEAQRQARMGNPEMLNEFNKHRKVLNLEPVTL